MAYKFAGSPDRMRLVGTAFASSTERTMNFIALVLVFLIFVFLGARYGHRE